MSNKNIKENASTYFIPYLLGNNKCSFKISLKILAKYGISSLIVDQKHSALDVLNLSCGFIKLSEATDFKIIAQELIDIASRDRYVLPILVPCSKKYEELVDKARNELEPIFVITDVKRLFSDSPLADIK